MTLEESKRYGWTVFVVVIILISAVVGAFIIQFKDLPLSETTEAWGQFGDYLGGTLNPFLAFLSFSALLFTIFIQLKQLNLSRTELALTRSELKRSADAQSDSKKVMQEQLLTQSLQQFDSIFFAMLRELNALLVELEKSEIGYGSKLTICYENVINEANSIQTSITELLKDREISKYFMLLFQVLKIIDKKINENIYLEENNKLAIKKMYSNIVRASISEKAMQLLMVNVLHQDFKPYKELVEMFSFFEHTSFFKNEKYSLLLINIAFYFNESAFDNSQYWISLNKNYIYSKFVIKNKILNYYSLYYKIFSTIDSREKLQKFPPMDGATYGFFSCELANTQGINFKIKLNLYDVSPFRFQKWIKSTCSPRHDWACSLYDIDTNTIEIGSPDKKEASFMIINFNEDGSFTYHLSEKIL